MSSSFFMSDRSSFEYEIANTYFSDDNTEGLIQLFEKGLPRNSCIFIYDSWFTYYGYTTLISFLLNTKYITTLHLDNCNIGTRHVSFLFSVLQTNDVITDLSLMGNTDLGDIGAIACADFLKHTKTLTKLSLNRTKLTSRSIPFISEAIENNTTLKSLDLSWNDIGEGNFKFLGLSLTVNKTLETLFLTKTKMTTQDLSFMISILCIMNENIIDFGFDVTLVTNGIFCNLIDLLACGNIIRFGEFDFHIPEEMEDETAVSLYAAQLMRNRHNRRLKRNTLFLMMWEVLQEEEDENNKRKRTRKAQPDSLPSRSTSRWYTGFVPIVNKV
jgi:hypothetical protein